MDLATTNLLTALSESVLELANKGNWDEAMLVAGEAVDEARDSSGGEFSGTVCLASTLEIKADLLRQQGFYEDSRTIYQEALEMINGREECNEMVARISASIGVLYDFVENDEEAIIYYERAIEMYEHLDPSLQEEVADICNNLGFIYRSLGDMDTAETLLLKGLEICHNAYGKNHEKTATLFNNVGALYLRSGYNEQAREMHAMALEGRLACFGENHPDTAQSYSNLALSLAQMGEKKQARKHFLKSISIFEKHIKTESHEYAAVIENYAEFLRVSEDKRGSTNVIKKAQKKLSAV